MVFGSFAAPAWRSMFHDLRRQVVGVGADVEQDIAPAGPIRNGARNCSSLRFAAAVSRLPLTQARCWCKPEQLDGVHGRPFD